MRTTTLRRFALPLTLGAAALVGGTPAVALDWGVSTTLPILSIPDTGICLPVRWSEALRIEPCFSYAAFQRATAAMHSETLIHSGLGLGLFATQLSGELGLYRGLRIKVDEENYQYQDMFGPAVRSVSRNVALGPVLGVDYRLTPQVFIGAELGLEFSRQIVGDGSHTSTYTYSQMILRYMF